MLVSVDELQSQEKNMIEKLFKKIRQRHANRIRQKGPSVVQMEAKENRFLETMMDMIDEGEFALMKRKIAESISKFAKKVEGSRSVFSGG